jgi:hypothetical protein
MGWLKNLVEIKIESILIYLYIYYNNSYMNIFLYIN